MVSVVDCDRAARVLQAMPECCRSGIHRTLRRIGRTRSLRRLKSEFFKVRLCRKTSSSGQGTISLSTRGDTGSQVGKTRAKVSGVTRIFQIIKHTTETITCRSGERTRTTAPVPNQMTTMFSRIEIGKSLILIVLTLQRRVGVPHIHTYTAVVCASCATRPPRQ